jgi:hypothetical protein
MKPYVATTGIFFALFSLFHVWELVRGLRAATRDPGFVVGLGAIIILSAALAFWAFRLLRLRSNPPPT